MSLSFQNGGSMNFYIADTHFGHHNVIRYDNRPFRTIAEMDNTMIDNWNKVVGDNDTVYILGDFSWYGFEDTVKILDSLRGDKVLIRGNHDPRKGILEQCYWDDIFREIELNGFLLTHRPKETDLINIHGHVHDKMPFWYIEDGRDKFNVSVDVIGFRPIAMEVIWKTF